MRTSKFSLILAILVCACCSNIRKAQAFSSISFEGEIHENTVWSEDTVEITGDVTLLDSFTLTINPGTRVEFQGSYSLIIYGTLRAIGTNPDSIVFTIKDSTDFHIIESEAGAWDGIIFNNSKYTGGVDNTMSDNDSTIIDHCILEFSKMADPEEILNGGAIRVLNFKKLRVSNSRISNNSNWFKGGAIYIYTASDILIRGNTIVNNTADMGAGIYVEGASPEIINNHIACNSTYPAGVEFGGGIYLASGRPYIRGNRIINNSAVRGSGIFENSSMSTITDNYIAYNKGYSDISVGVVSGWKKRKQ